jgi:hypothetical protein
MKFLQALFKATNTIFSENEILNNLPRSNRSASVTALLDTVEDTIFNSNHNTSAAKANEMSINMTNIGKTFCCEILLIFI